MKMIIKLDNMTCEKPILLPREEKLDNDYEVFRICTKLV